MENTNTFKTPPFSWKRNEFGLLDHITYSYYPDGRINYRALILPEFLVPNRYRTEETDVSKLEDKDLLILLAGIKYIAKIRGYRGVDHQIVSCSPTLVTVKTTITWIPNFETNGEEVKFSALADANLENTESFGKNFLAPIAENRGFIRAVRNFLEINVLGQEEVKNDGVEQPVSQTSAEPPHITSLLVLMNAKGVTFKDIQSKLVAENVTGAAEWTKLDDIPKVKVFELIDRLHNYKKG
jgi:hypothetical protein